MKNTKSFYIIFLIMVITACTPFGLLHKDQPRVTLALPARQETGPMNVVKRDSVSLPPVSNFTFVNSKGDSIPVGMSVEWDSIHKENLTTLALDEVVVSARSTRNTAERNGMVNIEFVVTVPQAPLNKLSKAGNFLKCYRVRKLVQEANGSSGGSNPSRCNSFLACLIAFAFCFSTRATGMSIL